MPDLTNYSRSDLEVLFKYLKIPYIIKGNGYVISQSIEAGTNITSAMQVELVLEAKVKNE